MIQFDKIIGIKKLCKPLFMNISLVFCKLMRAVFIDNWDEIKVNQIVEPYQVSLKMRRLFVISGGQNQRNK